ncbi:MAG TPA: hypothetical protein VFV99_13510 [Kofleriaceae bacterium]|nr:hypothetical protein [Kofleriaceae bacterium]
MRTLLTLVIVALICGVAGADVYKSKAGRVSIEVPKKWSVMAQDDLVRGASPNNEVAVVMWIVDSAEVKDALKKLEGELYSAIQGLRWIDKTKKLKVNKIAGTWVEGVGVSSRSTQLDVIAFVAATPTKKGVIVLAVVDHDKYEANRSAIQSIFGTLKTTK